MTRIGVVTDSSSQITPDLVDRFDVEVVPMTVTVDGVDHLEGVDLDADEFYAAFDHGRAPTITTAQPSPGRFATAYSALAARGYERAVSIHVSASMSGTVGTAELAARSAPIPVTVIDSGTASFGITICVRASGAVIAGGGSEDDVRREIGALVPRIATAFMIGVPHLAERSGRTADVELTDDGIQVLAMSAGALQILDRVSTLEDTVDVMSAYALDVARSYGDDATASVAIGTADAASRPLAQRLTTTLTGLDRVGEVVQYRVGPSIGAHTGPGTFGLFVSPTVS